MDAGNSRLKWALLDASGTLSAHGAADTAALRDATARATATAPLRALVDAHRPQRVFVSNVAGDAVQAALAETLQSLPIQNLRAVASCAGIHNSYLTPGQLGSDRFAALLGAHALADKSEDAKLIVIAGTALTIDALTPDGEFLGGSIAPGLRLMRESLARGTAQLPMAHENANGAFARDTDSAIAQGTRDAVVGAVLQSLERLLVHSASPICLLASGGAMPSLLPALEAAVHAVAGRATPVRSVTITMRPHLVLEGLAMFAASTAATVDATRVQT
jgi:type III pantothenate kinase